VGFLRRLFSGQPTTTAPATVAVPRPPPKRTISAVEFTEQRDDAWIDIVGEHAYEATLTAISSDQDPGELTPSPNRDALLVFEPDNQWDANAVAVYVIRPSLPAALVGYLSRENAVAYAPVLHAVTPDAVKTRATIRPPWRGPGGQAMPFSVQLHLGSPGELLAELWLGEHQVRTDHRWAAKTVAFTGPSGFAMGGTRLDRAGMEFLARRAGCDVWPRVTKQVDLCVSDTPDHETGNLKKAVEYGIPIVSEGDFWAELGVQLPRSR
jgi:hypothetical protein